MHSPELSHQFEDLNQQSEAADLGMWVFLVTEILFFGALFLAYTLYRWKFPDAFAGCSHLMNIPLGTLNTGVLLTSSLTMAFAVKASEEGRTGAIVRNLFLTILLGTVFLGIKGFEYHHKFVEHLIPGPNFQLDAPYQRPAQIFFSLYFTMTGLHALHMIIGLAILGVLMFLAARGRYTKTYHNPIRIVGLYWHFVDIVWIFLFPLLYLVGTH